MCIIHSVLSYHVLTMNSLTQGWHPVLRLCVSRLLRCVVGAARCFPGSRLASVPCTHAQRRSRWPCKYPVCRAPCSSWTRDCPHHTAVHAVSTGTIPVVCLCATLILSRQSEKFYSMNHIKSLSLLDLTEWYVTSSALALVDGKPWSLHQPLTQSCSLSLLTFKDTDPLLVNQVQHSTTDIGIHALNYIAPV